MPTTTFIVLYIVTAIAGVLFAKYGYSKKEKRDDDYYIYFAIVSILPVANLIIVIAAICSVFLVTLTKLFRVLLK